MTDIPLTVQGEKPMTEMELLQERIARMAANAVDQALAIKNLTKIIEDMHKNQHATNLGFTKMGKEMVIILKQLDEKTCLLEGRTVGIIERIDKLPVTQTKGGKWDG